MKALRIAVVIVVWGSILMARASAQPILNRVEQFLRDQVDAANRTPQPAEPGYLGLIGDDAGQAGRGVRVMEVIAGQPAANAGLRAGDLIIKIDERPIRAMDDMAQALSGKTAGTKLTMTVAREGKEEQFDVTLGRREQTGDPSGQTADTPRPRLGVRTVPVSDAVRRQNNLTAAHGAQVVSVTVGSPAERAGIPLGAIVMAVGQTPVNTPQDLAAAIGGATTNEVELTYVDRGQAVRKNVVLGAPLAAGDEAQREVRGRPPLPELPAPAEAAISDAAGPEAAPPVVENPALAQDSRIETLERRIEELAARIKSLEAELARQKTTPETAEQQ